MPRKIIHVVGTGTIGEPLIGLLCDFKEDLGIDEVTFHKNTPLLLDRSKVVNLLKRGARLSTNKEKWWTVSAFYSECDEIRENEDKMFSFKTVDEKLKFLDGINDYVMNLEQKYSDA